MTIKKRLLSLLLIFTMICTVFTVNAATESTGKIWKTFYVDPGAGDGGDGTEASPFGSLDRAQEEVRKYNKDMQGDIVVNLMPGRYEIRDNERWEFHVEDSGSNGYDVVYRAYDSDNLPVISAGQEVRGTWTEGENGIWHIKADNLEFAREMFVNDRTTIRARNPKVVYGDAYYKDENDNALGMYIDKAKLGIYENPEDIEFHFAYFWMDSIYQVDNIIQDPDNSNQVIAILERDVWSTLIGEGYGTQEACLDIAFTVENAYELLDEPGEFYFNKKTKILSYMPRDGEDMNTAEVLVPQADQLLYIRGTNYYERVKNIRFENIKFAHATNLAFEHTSYAGGQGEFPYVSSTNSRMGRAANTVDWAEYIDFEGCVFYGLTTIGLLFRHGVYHSDVTGCVFADLGASGFAAGHLAHITMTEPADKTGLADVAWQAGWESSSIHWPKVGGAKTPNVFYALNTQRSNDTDMSYKGYGWYSKAWEKDEGICPWIKIDLEDDYSLESFRFSFPDNATEEDRSNFEVLLSNERSFKDYKVLKRYTASADFMNEISIDDDAKYRYVMLRKTVPESFSLNGVWAMSADSKPKGQMGAPADCNITNNYVTRIGEQLPSSIGIWINYTKRFNVLHNYIHEVPYSAVSIGWGWANNNATTSGDNRVSFNRMDRLMYYTEDGGGIYTFGKQWGTEFRGNYISNQMSEGTGIYFDAGTCGVTAIDNVVQTTTSAYCINGKAHQNAMINLWSDRGYEHNNDDQTDNDMRIPKYFSLSNPPEDVMKIIGDAGIEDNWKWIEERVPDNKSKNLRGPDVYEASNFKRVNGMTASKVSKYLLNHADAILIDGTFGELPWQYNPEYKDDLEYWIEAYKTNGNRSDDYSEGHMEEALKIQEIVMNLNDMIYHPSWEEMLKMCDELLETAKCSKNWDGYPAKSVDKFKKELAEAKKLTPKTRSDKAVAALRLEKIYTELYQSGYRADIISGRVDNGNVDIDNKNKKITLSMTEGADTVNILPQFTTSKGSKLAAQLGDIDYSSGKVRIPVYQPKINKYNFYDMEIKESKVWGDNTQVSANPSEWTGGNINSPYAARNGELTVVPWYQPSMCTKPLDSSFTFNIMAPRADSNDGIGIIFCAKTDDLWQTTKELKNSYYMALLKGQNLTLLRVNSGVAKEIITARSIVFKYGEFNPFEITVTPEGDMDRIVISSEGAVIIDTLVDDPVGNTGYFGLLSKNMTVKIK